jgi:hypothetical protein
MKELFKKNRSLVNFCLGLIFFTLAVYLTPKNVSAVSSTPVVSDEGRSFLIFFIVGLVGGLLVFFSIKGNFLKKKATSQLPETKIISQASPGTYQYLIDEAETYKAELKKCRKMVIAYVAVLWTITWLGRFSGHPLYSSSALSSFLFITAFIAAAIVTLQKENTLDIRIVDCTLRGIELEKKHLHLRSNYFLDLASSYEGGGMLTFLFMRISPLLWLLFSGIQVGGLQALGDFIPAALSWNVATIAWLFFAASALFLGIMAYRPYEGLLKKIRALETKTEDC